jgi:hypothetical protein
LRARHNVAAAAIYDWSAFEEFVKVETTSILIDDAT